jgi:hypothetical protein
MEITIDAAKFRTLFPALSTATDEQIDLAYDGAGAYISTREGDIGLTEKLQIRSVYLATAHCLVRMFGNSISDGAGGTVGCGSAPVSSATEDDASASFALAPVNGDWQEELKRTDYGVQLLAILALVQPMDDYPPENMYPYYP